MTNKYKNKYRIESTRLQHWDYGRNASYFITICTKKRLYHFGDILYDQIQLSKIGKIAYSCWQEIPIHFPFVKLGSFVVMPNHVHGIVMIHKTDNKHENADPVETQDFASLRSLAKPNSPQNRFGPQSKNLASIIRGFKIGVTKNARQINPDFAWQPRYHDHIIRNKKDHQNVSKYIINNPAKWCDDMFYMKQWKRL